MSDVQSSLQSILDLQKQVETQITEDQERAVIGSYPAVRRIRGSLQVLVKQCKATRLALMMNYKAKGGTIKGGASKTK